LRGLTEQTDPRATRLRGQLHPERLELRHLSQREHIDILLTKQDTCFVDLLACVFR